MSLYCSKDDVGKKPLYTSVVNEKTITSIHELEFPIFKLNVILAQPSLFSVESGQNLRTETMEYHILMHWGLGNIWKSQKFFHEFTSRQNEFSILAADVFQTWKLTCFYRISSGKVVFINWTRQFYRRFLIGCQRK